MNQRITIRTRATHWLAVALLAAMAPLGLGQNQTPPTSYCLLQTADQGKPKTDYEWTTDHIQVGVRWQPFVGRPKCNAYDAARPIITADSSYAQFWVSWAAAEPTPAYTDYANNLSPSLRAIEAAVATCLAEGLKVEFVFFHCPAWASESGEAGGFKPKPNLFEGFVKRIATHFKGRVHAYQLAHEANLQGLMDGADIDFIVNDILINGAQAIRAVYQAKPDCPVLVSTTGMSPCEGCGTMQGLDGTGGRAVNQFYDFMIANPKLMNLIDALNLNVSDQNDGYGNMDGSYVPSVWGNYELARRKLDAANLRSKSILSSESWISWDDGESAVDVNGDGLKNEQDAYCKTVTILGQCLSRGLNTINLPCSDNSSGWAMGLTKRRDYNGRVKSLKPEIVIPASDGGADIVTRKILLRGNDDNFTIEDGSGYVFTIDDYINPPDPNHLHYHIWKWYAQIAGGCDEVIRHAVAGEIDNDVVVTGAGFTGNERYRICSYNRTRNRFTVLVYASGANGKARAKVSIPSKIRSGVHYNHDFSRTDFRGEGFVNGDVYYARIITKDISIEDGSNINPVYLETKDATVASETLMVNVPNMNKFTAIEFVKRPAKQGKSETAGKVTDRVNVFLGSDSSAQCSPAAIRPFGMISPGPFNAQVPCGYRRSSKQLIGFNHTHLQGTGCGSYGVLVLLPTTGNKELGTLVDVPANRQSAEPGYFKAVIDEMNITAEMTCTQRAAIHRYTFPKSDSARVLIDLSKGILWASHKPGEVRGELVQVDERTLSGSVTSTAWRDHTTWFHLEFNKDVSFTDQGEQGGYAKLATDDDEALLVKVGISYVSAENAKLNLETELPGWDFDAVRTDALAEWNQQLAKIDVKGGTKEQQANFYTAMYHLMFHPQTFSDVNGQYRGMDGKLHKTAGHTHYSVLSTWDTFRAAHPLYTLLNPDVQLDVIKTMLDDYRDSGWGPKWKLANTETQIMPGTWADVIIPDAYIKGITDFDTEAAFELVKKNANIPGRRHHLDDYLALGYVPYPNYINVSRTLEHAYCDFNIGRFAEALGNKDQADAFDARAKNYQQLWDSQTKFFRGKDKQGNWSYPDDFDPLTYTGKGNNDYCEGNAWQWTWHVMQDTQGLIDLLGGDAAFEARLDEFMTVQGGHSGSKEFGQYWHGNEPDQHALYAYNYVGVPAKTADKVRLCLETQYRNDPWGISGNEDAGQMSAWYIFSAMGFYPYLHSVPQYTIGSPIFDQVTLNLPNGKVCVITANNNSAENKYIQSMKINGKPWDKTFLPHDAIVGGAAIEFVMGPNPSAWGTSQASRPYSMTSRPDSGN